MVGNTHEIQTGRNPVRDWFLPVATKVKPDIANGSTAQGRYVVAADGTAYGYNNNRSLDRIHHLLDKSLAQFKATPPAKVEFAPSDLDAKFVPEPPPGSFVVRLFTRIKPAPLGSDSSNENIARDHLWILPEEAKALGRGELPDSFKTRLMRFTLIDNVRGEPDHWRAEEIRRESITLQRKNSGFILSGAFAMRTNDGKRGFEGSIDCALSIDSSGKVVSFKAFAEGQAWGRSTYTPNEPPGKFPLQIGFMLVRDEMSKVVAPQAVFYGREYLTGR